MLMEMLRDNGTITTEQFEQLRAAATRSGATQPVESAPAVPVAVPTRAARAPLPPRQPLEVDAGAVHTAAAPKAASDSDVETRGGLSVKSDDGRFAFELGGSLWIDAAVYDDERTPLGDGMELRRGRVSLAGRLYEHWEFQAEYDFAGNEAEVKDAFIAYDGLQPLTLKFGHFKEPFSLETQTSGSNLTFMERALPVRALSPGRRLGLGVSAGGERWGAATGVFGEAVGEAAADEGDSGLGAAGRVTYAPIMLDDRILHLGGSLAYRRTNDDDQVRFRTTPETGVAGARLVDTRTIADVSDTQALGLEAAVAFTPLTVQGEYIRTGVNRRSDHADLTFDGWYVSASWLITGEARRYDAERGRFRSIKPQHAYGAWELAIRYSDIDLSDHDIAGGRQQDITLGLNWYLNRNLRFLANYVHVDAAPNRNGVNETPNIFQVRAQLDF